jgi:hypothetical protein
MGTSRDKVQAVSNFLQLSLVSNQTRQEQSLLPSVLTVTGTQHPFNQFSLLNHKVESPAFPRVELHQDLVVSSLGLTANGEINANLRYLSPGG